MLDQYDRPCAWTLLLAAQEAFLKDDPTVAAIVSKEIDGENVVDVAQGSTPSLIAPCIRLGRGPEGAQPLSAWTYDTLPASIEFDIALYTQSELPRDDDLSARDPWVALGALEAAVIASERRFFAPQRDITSLLGGPFAAKIKEILLTDANYWPTVASQITIQLNKV